MVSIQGGTQARGSSPVKAHHEACPLKGQALPLVENAALGVYGEKKNHNCFSGKGWMMADSCGISGLSREGSALLGPQRGPRLWPWPKTDLYYSYYEGEQKAAAEEHSSRCQY